MTIKSHDELQRLPKKNQEDSLCRCWNTKEKHLSLEYDNKHLTTFVTCCLNRTNDQNNIT